MARGARLVLAIFAAALLLAPSRADACSCVVGAPLCETYWKTPIVFAGQVVSIDNVQPQGDSYRWRRVRFRVDSGFRGRSVTEVYTGSGGGDCGYNFVVGEKYLVYAAEFQGRVSTGICSPTKKLSDASHDLAYISQSSAPAAAGRVFGTAVFATDGSLQPVAKQKVVMRGPSREWTAVTDATGKFELKEVPAGKYRVELLGPPGWQGRESREIELPDPRGCAAADFYLRADGRVHLKVTDVAIPPTKAPSLELIEVDALSDPPAMRRSTHASAVTTGDVMWELVPPGRYVIGLNITWGPNLEHPYPATFYPGVADVKDARVIEVRLGERVELPPFKFPQAQPTLSFRGSIVRKDASEVAGANVALISDAAYSKGRVVSVAQSDRAGRFTLNGVAGWRYRVRTVSAGVTIISEPFELTPATAPLLVVFR